MSISFKSAINPKKRQQQKIIQFSERIAGDMLKKNLMYIQWLHFYICALSENPIWYQKWKKIVSGKNVWFNGYWPVNMVKESSYFWFQCFKLIAFFRWATIILYQHIHFFHTPTTPSVRSTCADNNNWRNALDWDNTNATGFPLLPKNNIR